MQKVVKADESRSRVEKAAPPKAAEPYNTKPVRFTYALAAYTTEIRGDGWYVAKTTPSFTGERQKWIGPFASIETACLCIGRHLATEIADRHTRAVETHKIKRGEALYGLKVTTKLDAR